MLSWPEYDAERVLAAGEYAAVVRDRNGATVLTFTANASGASQEPDWLPFFVRVMSAWKDIQAGQGARVARWAERGLILAERPFRANDAGATTVWLRPGTGFAQPGTAFLRWHGAVGGLSVRLEDDTVSQTSTTRPPSLNGGGQWQLAVTGCAGKPSGLPVASAAWDDPVGLDMLAQRLMSMTDPDANMVEAFLNA